MDRDAAETAPRICTDLGCPHIRTQLAFTDRELRHDPKFTCFWGASTTPAAYTALRRIFGRGSC